MELPIDRLWDQVLERLQVQLGRPTFDTWIKTAWAEQLDNNCLIIRTPNPFSCLRREILPESNRGFCGV